MVRYHNSGTQKFDNIESESHSTGSATVDGEIQSQSLQTTEPAGLYHNHRDADSWYFDGGSNGNLSAIPDGSQVRIRFQAQAPFGVGFFRVLFVAGDTSTSRGSDYRLFTAQLRDGSFSEATNTSLLGIDGAVIVDWEHTGSNEEFDFYAPNNTGSEQDDWALQIESLAANNLTLSEAVVEPQ